MSNSAFTPTTTEVTTEVPVNVPVVTAWEAYTPTLTNFTSAGTNASNSGRWRRVGDSMEIVISTRMGSTGTASGVFYWGLPSGFTVDSTKLPQSGSGIRNSPGSIVWFDRSANQFVNAVPSVDSSLNAVWAVVTGTGLPSNIESTNVPTNSDDSFSISVRVPIAEWAGSGTTTLATRAVEEYAFNTNTGASNDTSSFGYGPDGVLFPNITTYGTIFAKRVRFQTSILSTDSIIVEYQQAGTGVWRSTAQRMPYVTMGNSAYGIQILNVSSTDVEIQFNSQGAVSNGLTYASNGELWSAYHGAGWKWRVRKISSGAQVGYPVSARNIVGDTSGSVVPVGMLGEVRTVTGSGTLQVNPSTYGDIAGMSLQLGPGTWMLTLKAAAYIKHNAAGNQINTVNLILTDSSNAVIANSPVQAQVENQPQTSGTAMQFVWNLTSTTVWTNTTTQSIKMRGLRSNLTGGIELLNDSDARITAIIATRIA